MPNSNNSDNNGTITKYSISLCHGDTFAVHAESLHPNQWSDPDDPTSYTISTSEITVNEARRNEIKVNIQTNNLNNALNIYFDSQNCNFVVHVDGLNHTFVHNCPNSR